VHSVSAGAGVGDGVKETQWLLLVRPQGVMEVRFVGWLVVE